jgi:hypothetical protein
MFLKAIIKGFAKLYIMVAIPSGKGQIGTSLVNQPKDRL